MQSSRSTGTLVNLATLALAVAALYFGKPVLVPLALATLLSFLLAPVVNSVIRNGIRAPIAVTLVVIFLGLLFTMAAWGVGSQLRALVYELPDYRQNVREKIADLRSASKGPTLDRIRQTWREIRGELHTPSGQTNAPASSAPAPKSPAEREPVPVVVQGSANADSILPSALFPVMEILASASLVFVLVIFMLLRRRELRNRMLLLFGYSRLPTTTRALDEAAGRISHYLLMQTIVNSGYGIAVGVTLYFIGLPYALLWGLLAAVLRFVPYVGAWLGAAMPVLLSLAVFPGWLHAFLVLGIIAIFELANNMFVEPMLYGHSAGVSEVALLVAVAFWTWIWGPIGLALATPLTVCLAVLGKYVPGLSFLYILLGDEAVMEPPLEFYQRLLAMDDTEAGEIALAYRKDHDLIEVYDELFLPALIQARRDHIENKLNADHLDFIINATGQLITRLGHRERAQAAADETEFKERKEVFAIPVQDTIDELVMAMLGHSLPAFVTLRAVPAEALSGEILAQLAQQQPPLICIGSIVPGGVKETRYLLKRICTMFPQIPTVVARWGLKNEKKERTLAQALGIREICVTLKSTRNYLLQLLQLRPEPTPSVALPLAAESASLAVESGPLNPVPDRA